MNPWFFVSGTFILGRSGYVQINCMFIDIPFNFWINRLSSTPNRTVEFAVVLLREAHCFRWFGHYMGLCFVSIKEYLIGFSVTYYNWSLFYILYHKYRNASHNMLVCLLVCIAFTTVIYTALTEPVDRTATTHPFLWVSFFGKLIVLIWMLHIFVAALFMIKEGAIYPSVFVPWYLTLPACLCLVWNFLIMWVNIMFSKIYTFYVR